MEIILIKIKIHSLQSALHRIISVTVVNRVKIQQEHHQHYHHRHLNITTIINQEEQLIHLQRNTKDHNNNNNNINNHSSNHGKEPATSIWVEWIATILPIIMLITARISLTLHLLILLAVIIFFSSLFFVFFRGSII